MDLDERYMSSVEVGELVDVLVARREKIFRSGEVVGQAGAEQSCDDVVTAIDALKAVFARLALP